MGKIRRLENWPLALAAFLRERESKDFQYGDNDCLLFAADAILAVTGKDVAARWRGGYTNHKSAYDIVHGYGGMAKLITAALGFEPHQNVRLAGRGDVVCVSIGENKLAAGVVDDSGAAVAVLGHKGIHRVKIETIVFVWSY